tara:strand:+ start:2524 stop:2700 length:177 start_codon:yes stop_codon:yes gene_type:complete
MTVGFENTMTEQDMNATSRQLVQNLQQSSSELAPDLDIDGLSDSIGVRLKRFLAFGRA